MRVGPAVRALPTASMRGDSLNANSTDPQATVRAFTPACAPPHGCNCRVSGLLVIETVSRVTARLEGAVIASFANREVEILDVLRLHAIAKRVESGIELCG